MGSRALTVTCVVVGGLAVGAAYVGGQAAVSPGSPPYFTEMQWPFAFDAWGPGRAFRCAAPACGFAVAVYVRPKVGFCNCYTGVADDDEIDRVGDVGLVGENYRPLEAGKPVSLGDMRGRARTFLVEHPREPARHAIGIAVSKKCDALVATVVSDRPIPPGVAQAAFAHLNAEPVLRWAQASVGQ